VEQGKERELGNLNVNLLTNKRDKVGKERNCKSGGRKDQGRMGAYLVNSTGGGGGVPNQKEGGNYRLGKLGEKKERMQRQKKRGKRVSERGFYKSGERSCRKRRVPETGSMSCSIRAKDKPETRERKSREPSKLG